jgi:transcriptional regulator with XRE-family HTH domain
VSVPSPLDKKLAAFLKKQRGEMSFATFSKKTGFSPSMLFRLENCEQSITLGRLQQILDRLRCDLDEVFGSARK